MRLRVWDFGSRGAHRKNARPKLRIRNPGSPTTLQNSKPGTFAKTLNPKPYTGKRLLLAGKGALKKKKTYTGLFFGVWACRAQAEGFGVDLWVLSLRTRIESPPKKLKPEKKAVGEIAADMIDSMMLLGLNPAKALGLSLGFGLRM